MLKTVVEQKVPDLILDSEFRVRNQVGTLLKVVLSQCDAEISLTHFKRLKDLLV